MLVYFSVDQRHHGVGPVKYAWDPSGNYLASTGSSRVVHIFDRRGNLVDQIVPPSPSICTHVEWSATPKDKPHQLMLAIAQANSSLIVLWSVNGQTKSYVDVGVKEVTLLKWNKLAHSTAEVDAAEDIYLAIGTSRGQVLFYRADHDPPNRSTTSIDHRHHHFHHAQSKHKKKILCGEWNTQNEFAFGSEDRQITICDAKNGATLDQVKIRAAPIDIQFGSRHHHHHHHRHHSKQQRHRDLHDNQQVEKQSIVSVNMGRQTILLYDRNKKDSVLELAFQAKYGSIVQYHWFGNGYIIAGFSSGFVVIMSTQMHEIGHEQYCAKFHEHHLFSICYNDINGMVATCGDSCIKVVRMADWKEIAVEDLDRHGHFFEDLQWTQDGRLLSVSCRHNGWLHHFKLFHMEQQAVCHRRSKKQQSTNLLSQTMCHTVLRMIPFFHVFEDLMVTTTKYKNAHLFDTVDEDVDVKQKRRLYLSRLKLSLNTVYRYVINPLRKVFLEEPFTGVSLSLTMCGVSAFVIMSIAATVDPVFVSDNVDNDDLIHYYLVSLPSATIDVLQTIAGRAIRF